MYTVMCVCMRVTEFLKEIDLVLYVKLSQRLFIGSQTYL